MSIAAKLTTIAENQEKVYNKGGLDYSPQETVSGEAIGIKDISPIEHNMGVSVRKKNLIPFPYYSKSQTKNGITFTVNEDGTVTVNGTATANAMFTLSAKFNLETDKQYVMSGCAKGGSGETYYISLQRTDYKDTQLDCGVGNGRAFVSNYHEWYCWIMIQAGVTVKDLVFKPMIEEGTIATSYAPYIEDISTVKLCKQGKNLLDYYDINKWELLPLNASNLESRKVYQLPLNNVLKVGQTYTLSIDVGTTFNHTLFIQSLEVGAEKSTSVSINSGGVLKPYKLIVNPNTYYWLTPDASTVELLQIRYLALKNAQLELGTTPTEYEPYIEPVIYDVSSSGIVEGVTSLYPSTTLYTDTSGAVIDCTYYQDGRKVKENLTDMILSLGGVINE